MGARKVIQDHVTLRKAISSKVRDLRKERLWTQARLARELGLSQARLSEIERGAGSFTAEQFIAILRLFNVSLSHFVATSAAPNAALQNALARLGATHLRESADASPSHDVDIHDTLLQALTSGDARLVTSLAPVLVAHADRISLNALDSRLVAAGLDRRLAWVVDNTLDALQHVTIPAGRANRLRHRRAALVLETYLDFATARERARENGPKPPADILDLDIRSRKSLDAVRASSSEISKRWNLVTIIRADDFRRALEAARARD